MSRFLKFIVHTVIFCTVLGILALVIPPFAGINTTVIDSLEEESNLPFGSATYAKEVDAGEIAVGDAILLKDGSGIYRCTVLEYDEAEGIYTIKDARDPNADPKETALKSRPLKFLFTIPALGLLLVAVQSTEGLIILGLAILFLIVLYIIAELWKKEPKKNEEGVPEAGNVPALAGEQGHIKTKKELKMEEKARLRREKEEERRLRAEEKARKKAEKKAIRVGGFVDEVEEEEIYGGIREGQEPEPEFIPAAEQEAREEQLVSAMEATSLVSQDTQEMPPLREMQNQEEPSDEAPKDALPEAEKDAGQLRESVPSVEEEVLEPEPEPVIPQEIKKMAIPLYTAEELMRKSREAGESPEVYQDELTGVTLFDYSEIIAGTGEDGEK